MTFRRCRKRIALQGITNQFRRQTDITEGEWVHITFVADGDNEKKVLYLNGEPDAEWKNKQP